jgi:DNA polymerase-3 subunit epsilon
MREIVLDTETTGINPLDGDRLVEIGCVELVNHLPSGRTFHCYLNPERDMPAEAQAVHGLTSEFLKDKPVFAETVGDFLDFVADAKLVIHNAAFDMGFINAELTRLGMRGLPMDRAIDTVQMARRRYPGAPASLDALCRRFAIDNSSRTFHGALLDAQLLSEVYLELLGGREPGLILAATAGAVTAITIERPIREPRPHAPTAAEAEAHLAFVKSFKVTALWLTEPGTA